MNRETLQKKTSVTHDIFSSRWIGEAGSGVFSCSLEKHGLFRVVPLGPFNPANRFTDYAIPYEWLKDNSVQRAQSSAVAVHNNTTLSYFHTNNTVNLFKIGVGFSSLMNKRIGKNSLAERPMDKQYVATFARKQNGKPEAAAQSATPFAYICKLFTNLGAVNSKLEKTNAHNIQDASTVYAHPITKRFAERYGKPSTHSGLKDDPRFYDDKHTIYKSGFGGIEDSKVRNHAPWTSASTSNIDAIRDGHAYLEKRITANKRRTRMAQRESVNEAINALAANSTVGKREDIAQQKALQQQLKDADQCQAQEMRDLRKSISQLHTMMSAPKSQASFIPAVQARPPSFYGRLK